MILKLSGWRDSEGTKGWGGFGKGESEEVEPKEVHVSFVQKVISKLVVDTKRTVLDSIYEPDDVTRWVSGS